MMPQQYCLRWKHHHSNVQNMFAQLLEKERFCDVTLYCSPSFATQVTGAGADTVEPHNIRGVSLRAHRVVLAACSELLGALLGAHEAHGEPVLVIDGAEPRHLRALLDYMYTGEMNVHHSQLASLLKTAEELRIKGLTDIRWNNKDEPPDCQAGIVATATPTDPKHHPEKQTHIEAKQPKHASPKNLSPKHSPELPEHKPKDDEHRHSERFNVNGGPPPLIKLPVKEKNSPAKRENSDSDSPSPKRQRQASRSEHTDDETLSIPKLERDQEWQHGNLVRYTTDITAERVVGWGMRGTSRGSRGSAASTSRDASDDEWADAPADIGSFLHTRLRVDGDNSADEESNESAPRAAASAASSSSLSAAAAAASELRVELAKAQMSLQRPTTTANKSGPTDPRFTDVVKLSDYLQHGRRPQFWEENYVKRVMEAVRLKELEMKQAAEILGVSYGTLYGRYRDVYGCINRPYRAVRDFWQAKGPSEVLERLQRGEVSLDAAAQALGVSIANLAAHVADFDFEQPIPIEMDPSLKVRSRTYSAGANKPPRNKPPAPAPANTNTNTSDKGIKKIVIGSVTDEEPIPATLIAAYDASAPAAPPPPPPSGKWPSIRVASLDTLRGPEAGAPAPAAPASPSALMRTRPDLTIVAARKHTADHDDHS